MLVLFLFQHIRCHILSVGGDGESLRKLGGVLWVYWLPLGSFNTKKSLILTLFNPFSLPPCPDTTPQIRSILIFLYYCWKVLGPCLSSNGCFWCLFSNSQILGTYLKGRKRRGLEELISLNMSKTAILT